MFWAADIRGAISNPPDILNVIVDWDAYDGTMGSRGTGFMTQANDIVTKKNMLLLVNEMGFYDSGSAVEDKYKFLTSNGISFTVFAFNSGTGNANFIINNRGITEQGRLAQKYFNVPR